LKLTTTAINGMKYEGTPPKGKDLRWDDEVPGFYVRVLPSGKKTFGIKYHHRGRPREMTLGAYGVLTLPQARDKARSIKVQAQEGADPLRERKKRHEGQTFAQLATAYLERHAPKKRSRRDDESMLRLHLLPALGTTPLAEITRADIARLHHKLGKKRKAASAAAPRQGRDWKKGESTGGPALANRVLSLLSKMFALAVVWGFLPEGTVNPAHGIDRFKEVERERFLTPEELKRLADAIEQELNPFIRAGCRKMEVLRLRWSDIDFKQRVINFRKTKTKDLHILPLTKDIERILQTLPQLGDNPYIFPGNITGKHLVSIDKNWDDIRKRAGIADVRIHDLRHTVATWLISSGMEGALVGRVLGHSDPRSTKRYAKFMLKSLTDALEGHGAELAEATKQLHGDPA
jgi:integrase